MTKRKPELLQVLVGQVRQDLAVNVVLGKYRPVPASPSRSSHSSTSPIGERPRQAFLAMQVVRVRRYPWPLRATQALRSTRPNSVP